MLRIQRNTVIQTRSRQMLIASRTNFERLKMDTLIVYVSVYVVKNTFISSILNAQGPVVSKAFSLNGG